MKSCLYTITLNGGYYKGPAVPLLEIFEKAKGWGYDGVEIEGKRPHGSPLDLGPVERKAIKKAAKDNGLEIPCVAAYNDFSSPIEEHRENELLMVRELMQLAADVGAPLVRVFSFWSGVSRRDGCITYDIARYNQEHRFPGTTRLEQWCYVRECLVEAAAMAEKIGVTLALQNHRPVINSYHDMLAFIKEVNSPALKACLDRPLFPVHTEEYYRQSILDTGKLMVHSHFGGRYERKKDGSVGRLVEPGAGTPGSDMLFMRLAHALIDFKGYNGYELCGPVLNGHKHEGQKEALRQAQLAGEYMRNIIDTIKKGK